MTPKQAERFNKELKKLRIKFPQEVNKTWLSILLDAYHIVDAGVKVEISTQKRASNRIVACKKGCSNCCKRPSFPINLLEFQGLCWYATEMLNGEVREQVQSQLSIHRERTECPFLINDNCSVYPVRPIACRCFFMFDVPCNPDEDPWFDRPQDMLNASNTDIAWLVSKKFFIFHGIKNEKEQKKAFDEGFMFNNTKPLHLIDWSQVVQNMSSS